MNSCGARCREFEVLVEKLIRVFEKVVLNPTTEPEAGATPPGAEMR